MQTIPTNIPDVFVIKPKRHGDARGYFTETFRDDWFRANIADITFVQDNHSLSEQAGTLRGLHFQTPPHAQAKLVRCLAGAIWDVAVDIRANSASYGQWAAAELSTDNGCQLYIPEGFAHGFITLSDATEVAYKCSDYYAPDCDAGLAWDDPKLTVLWPLEGRTPVLSQKDTAHPEFADFVSPF